MPASQLAAVLALIGVLIASIVVLRMDSRRRKLAERVEDLPELGDEFDPSGEQRQSIRRPQRSSARAHNLFCKIFAVPVDLKFAQVIPNWVVFAFGIMVAGLDLTFGRLYFSLPISLVGGIVSGIVVVRAIFKWEFARYGARLRRQLPDAIELLVSTTNAGLPVSEGFRAIAREMPQPTGEEFKRIVGEIALGARIDMALRTLHHRTRVPEYAILAVTLSVQARSGGRLAETILTLADTVCDNACWWRARTLWPARRNYPRSSSRPCRCSPAWCCRWPTPAT